MMQLATIESLLGSVWAALASFFVGYLIAHVIPVTRVASWFARK